MSKVERADIQSGILEGYRKSDYVTHLFVRFTNGSGPVVLRELLPLVTTAEATLETETTALNLGLSYAGLAALDLPEDWRRSLPEAFREGMHQRAPQLGDDIGKFEPEWQRAADVEQPVHLWVSLHAPSEASLKLKRSRVIDCLTGYAKCFELEGRRLRDSEGNVIEHFGFRDGISQPAIEGSLKPMAPGAGITDENGNARPFATGEFVLGHPDETGDVPSVGSDPDLMRNGTFAVVRKLEQDVAAFREQVSRQANLFRALQRSRSTVKLPKDVDEWLAERMVGRRRNGTPLVRDAGGAPQELNSFSFQQDEAGRECPLGSHIRRANPRRGGTLDAAFSRHRILRRSVTYGPPYDESAARDGDKRGVLFVAVGADIERQFEFLQRRYLNDGAAVRQGHDTDPLTAATPGAHFVIPGDADRSTFICSLGGFVTCRGGEYFFMPGLQALTRLVEMASSAVPRTVSGIAPRPDPVVPEEKRVSEAREEEATHGAF